MTGTSFASSLCVFCRIVNGDEKANITAQSPYCLEIDPLNPVTPGHKLVIPRRHSPDALHDPTLTARVMMDAARWTERRQRDNPIYRSVNFITSVGLPATQTVFHLHIHVVPRDMEDGLKLPWTDQVIPT